MCIRDRYTNGSYSWSDGLTNDVMDLNKLKEMVNEIISLQITPNPRYKDMDTGDIHMISSWPDDDE